MSHELKTPLTALREGAELLQRRGRRARSPRAAQVVAIMRDNSIKLQRLIEDLLDYQRALHAAAALKYSRSSSSAVEDAYARAPARRAGQGAAPRARLAVRHRPGRPGEAALRGRQPDRQRSEVHARGRQCLGTSARLDAAKGISAARLANSAGRSCNVPKAAPTASTDRHRRDGEDDGRPRRREERLE